MSAARCFCGISAGLLLFSVAANCIERSDVARLIIQNGDRLTGTAVYVDMGGMPLRAAFVKADDAGLTAEIAGNTVIQAWDEFSGRRLLQIARKAVPESNGDGLLVLYSFAAARDDLKTDAQEIEAILREKFPERLKKDEPKPAAGTAGVKPEAAPEQVQAVTAPTAVGGAMTPGPFLKAPRGTSQGIFRGHPKIYVRDGDAAPAFGISLGELRRRAKTAPWSAWMGRLKEVQGEIPHYSVPNLALAWLANGDDAAARRAIEIMKRPIRMDGTTYMGDHLEAVCLGYDWLYNYPGFSSADKDDVKAKILKSAEEMRRIMHDHVFHTRPFAWANGVMFAGLALYPEEPKAEALAKAAIEQYKNYLFPARRMLDGAWQNAMSYGRKYLVRSAFAALAAWSSATGEDLWYQAGVDGNWAERTIYMLIYACRPDYSYVTYGDLFASAATAEGHSYANLLCGTYGTRNPYGQGFMAELEKKYGAGNVEVPEFAYYYPLFCDPSIPAASKVELPLSQMFGQHSMGLVFMRSGWGPKDLFIMFKCGDYFDDHGHFDQGTFEIFYQKPLAVDSGLYGGDAGFGSSHRMNYMRRSIAHNTLVFPDAGKPDDEGGQRVFQQQSIADPKAFPSECDTGDIVRYEDTPVYTYTLGDLARAYDRVKVFYRHFVYLKPDVIVIFDAVVVNNPQYRRVWLYHYPTAAQIEGNRFRVVNGGGGVAVETLLPKPAKIADVQGFKVGGKDYPATGGDPDVVGKGYVTVEPEQATGTGTYFLHVLTIGGSNVTPTPVVLTEDSNALKLQIKSKILMFSKDGKAFQCP